MLLAAVSVFQRLLMPAPMAVIAYHNELLAAAELQQIPTASGEVVDSAGQA